MRTGKPCSIGQRRAVHRHRQHRVAAVGQRLERGAAGPAVLGGLQHRVGAGSAPRPRPAAAASRTPLHQALPIRSPPTSLDTQFRVIQSSVDLPGQQVVVGQHDLLLDHAVDAQRPVGGLDRGLRDGGVDQVEVRRGRHPRRRPRRRPSVGPGRHRRLAHPGEAQQLAGLPRPGAGPGRRPGRRPEDDRAGRRSAPPARRTSAGSGGPDAAPTGSAARPPPASASAARVATVGASERRSGSVSSASTTIQVSEARRRPAARRWRWRPRSVSTARTADGRERDVHRDRATTSSDRASRPMPTNIRASSSSTTTTSERLVGAPDAPGSRTRRPRRGRAARPARRPRPPGSPGWSAASATR